MSLFNKVMAARGRKASTFSRQLESRAENRAVQSLSCLQDTFSETFTEGVRFHYRNLTAQ